MYYIWTYAFDNIYFTTKFLPNLTLSYLDIGKRRIDLKHLNIIVLSAYLCKNLMIRRTKFALNQRLLRVSYIFFLKIVEIALRH